MPAYNAEKYIAQAIESMLSQSYGNIELLIADDCSTDGTLKIIRRYESDLRVKLFRNELNSGYLKTTNFLFDKCSGDFITFLDADDFCDINRIAKQLNFLNNFSDISCVGCFVQRIDENNKHVELLSFRTNHDDIYNALPDEYHFVGSAVMIRRNVLDAEGGFHPVFDRIGSEDLYWLSKITLKFKISNIAEPLYYYRHSGESVSAQNKRSIEGQFSKELAQIAFLKLRDEKIDIFSNENKSFLHETTDFLRMKYNFWNGNYMKGVLFGIKGIISGNNYSSESKIYIRMYLSKILKSLFSFKLNKITVN